MVGPQRIIFDLLVERLDGFVVPTCGFTGYVSKGLEKTTFVRRQRTAQQLRNEKFS
jgi:hypothetical protein